MPRPTHVLLALTLLAALCVPLAPASAAPRIAPASAPGDAFAFFPQTGHNIGTEIKQFYDANGGLDIFGLPLTEVFLEDGLQVQYFERARFELHPELPKQFYVTLTHLGRWLTNDRSEPAFQWQTGSSPDRTYLPESGHSLGGSFRTYWQQHGGLAVFGYPLSEELLELNSVDQQPYVVQYFERARFELHPEHAGTPYEVQLSHIGRQVLNTRPAAMAQTAPVPAMVLLGQATTGFATSAAERELNIAQATNMFNGVIVMPGQEYSFLNSGDFNENAGFVEGYAIVGGRLEKVIGGGLCQVSTTMFRAASNAGLEITRRQGHSFVVYFYENILGFDATVFSPDLDFRWRNDTPHPIYMATSTNIAAATVTFQLWGIGDGRSTSYRGPFVRNVVQPSIPVWQYDSNMRRGAVSQLVHGREGMDVNYYRTVTMPDGTIKHNNNFYTHYDPWEDFYTYGPGVNPPAGARVIEPRNS